MNNQIEIYQGSDGQTQIEVKFEKETVWLNQKQMGILFDKDTDTIGLHLKNIYKDEELDEISTTEDFSVVQQEGKRKVTRNIKFTVVRLIYFLDCKPVFNMLSVNSGVFFYPLNRVGKNTPHIRFK